MYGSSAEGNIVQVGTPAELFERPQTTFVGYFIGAPAMNFFECECVDAQTVAFGSAKIATQTNLEKVKTKNLKLGIRSEYITLTNSVGGNTLRASVQNVEDMGNNKLLTAIFEGNSIKIKVKREVEVPEDIVFLKFPAERCCVYQNEKLL